MKNFLFFILFFFFLTFFSPVLVFAESSYVLPYPSSMPGSLFYKVHLVFEGISKYWYFGDFGQFEYNLKMADKYLVEAKTLLEYKQYLLGYKSLQESDFYFSNILPSLMKAEKNNKNIVQKNLVLKQAAGKHIETLEKMELNTPAIFIWQPEKALPTTLYLKKAIISSALLRKKSL